ncbi:hypothetical protein E5F05_19725 [Deinococcus metallilatus]|uniref:EF-hand domain-containing protein n=1 Tax=Deinococcus metallilatus TaxID=1211322 RepID=A0AAJ5F3Q1_9DEIO|nr:hypothetical protein [Deinococcus metallilatus]MBB5296347.1 hypothetical protein [Deinococcus metallilatus]QBY09974.1 hypothetical protein E5F05_19725 [Deinococcus metallilatus]RXJ08698.1 hypothetical protein ERJ73_18565 [Deinococcus metallilatus]TLK25172.1 hypothetical protein FCS05_13480 [Deinococcus metallilatus]GMA14739.1 hypothetical protein GCM10025871_10700 [Deinococcus metallilatus]
MFFDQKDRHEQMARLDPRDTNGDGTVTPQEAAAYIHDYLQNASPEERRQIMQDYFGQMSPQERQQVGDAIVRSPANPVQNVRADDPSDLADAYTRTAQAPAQDNRSPLEAAFAQGGALSNPLVKAGLVGLAAAIGSKLLRH